MSTLNGKMELFCHEYLVDYNATKAATRAGYSANTAASQGSRLLTNVKVQERIKELQKETIERLAITREMVIAEHFKYEMADSSDIFEDDLETFKPLSEWPDVWRRNIEGIEISDIFEGKGEDRQHVGFIKKVKFSSKMKNRELLGRSLGTYTEKIELADNRELCPFSSIVAGVDK
ncbi:terminase small subunit [Vibrio harveyi]|uniref:terminase small subunit n=1 Tax=Vibrio harveyi TaxID=669 RepID=UPI000D7852CC|nr:terminase small subunit [Vibrio harveyi]GBK97733.1 phage terminase small subunit [Vibrio harveyi]HDM8061689.1 terminase small subunit [Vibrio harveyi]